MYQLACKSDEFPENYIVRGLNGKYNYFVSVARIYDLEHDIPMGPSVQTTLKIKDKSRFNKQQKIYEDSSRYLSIENQSLIHFPITRIDILFWKNLKEDL